MSTIRKTTNKKKGVITMTRLIIDVDDSTLCGQIGTPAGIKFKDTVLHLGDVVKLKEGEHNREGKGVVMLWSSDVIISGYGLVPIDRLEIDSIVCSHDSSDDELNDHYLEKDLVVAHMTHAVSRDKK